MSATAGSRPWVAFLLGITHRSGTNFLAELLARHPQVEPHSIPEDYLVAKLQALEGYVSRVVGEWNPRWGAADQPDRLRRGLGEGLLAYVAGNVAGDHACAGLVLARTPAVTGLSLFRQYFPSAPAILLVRDGRSVVESGMRSFAWRFDDAALRWSAAARALLEFKAAEPVPGHALVVRYEDVLADRAGETRRMLRFLGLAESDYPFEALDSLPVRGSSELVSSAGQALDWAPRPPADSFAPRERHAGWSVSQRARFDWIAGDALEALGYSRDEGLPAGSRAAVRQRLRDAKGLIDPLTLRRRIRAILRGRR